MSLTFPGLLFCYFGYILSSSLRLTKLGSIGQTKTPCHLASEHPYCISIQKDQCPYPDEIPMRSKLTKQIKNALFFAKKKLKGKFQRFTLIVLILSVFNIPVF